MLHSGRTASTDRTASAQRDLALGRLGMTLLYGAVPWILVFVLEATTVISGEPTASKALALVAPHSLRSSLTVDGRLDLTSPGTSGRAAQSSVLESAGMSIRSTRATYVMEQQAQLLTIDPSNGLVRVIADSTEYAGWFGVSSNTVSLYYTKHNRERKTDPELPHMRDLMVHDTDSDTHRLLIGGIASDPILCHDDKTIVVPSPRTPYMDVYGPPLRIYDVDGTIRHEAQFSSLKVHEGQHGDLAVLHRPIDGGRAITLGVYSLSGVPVWETAEVTKEDSWGPDVVALAVSPMGSVASCIESGGPDPEQRRIRVDMFGQDGARLGNYRFESAGRAAVSIAWADEGSLLILTEESLRDGTRDDWSLAMLQPAAHPSRPLWSKPLSFGTIANSDLHWTVETFDVLKKGMVLTLHGMRTPQRRASGALLLSREGEVSGWALADVADVTRFRSAPDGGSVIADSRALLRLSLEP